MTPFLISELYPAQLVPEQMLPEDPAESRGSDGQGRLLGDRSRVHQGPHTALFQGGGSTPVYQAETSTQHKGKNSVCFRMRILQFVMFCLNFCRHISR